MLCLATPREVSASELIIEWTAPPECPEQAEVVSNVERSLGDDARVNLTVTASVTRAQDLYRAHVHIASPAGLGERTLENARCDVLAESVAVVIALSVPPPVAGARPREHMDGLAPALSAHAAAVTGPLPRLALGGGGTFALEGIAALRLELGATYYAHQSATFDDTEIGAHFKLLALGVRGCRVWALGAFELAPCLGAQFYRITGEGFGGKVSHSGGTLMWGPALGVLARLRVLAQLALDLTIDGVVPIARQRFVFSDVGSLHRASAFAFQFFVGPEVRF